MYNKVHVFLSAIYVFSKNRRFLLLPVDARDFILKTINKNGRYLAYFICCYFGHSAFILYEQKRETILQ